MYVLDHERHSKVLLQVGHLEYVLKFARFQQVAGGLVCLVEESFKIVDRTQILDCFAAVEFAVSSIGYDNNAINLDCYVYTMPIAIDQLDVPR